MIDSGTSRVDNRGICVGIDGMSKRCHKQVFVKKMLRIHSLSIVDGWESVLSHEGSSKVSSKSLLCLDNLSLGFDDWLVGARRNRQDIAGDDANGGRHFTWSLVVCR